jgi:hypothetical protein
MRAGGGSARRVGSLGETGKVAGDAAEVRMGALVPGSGFGSSNWAFCRVNELGRSQT